MASNIAKVNPSNYKVNRGDRITSKKELIAFLNSFGVAKKLKILATLMLPLKFKFKLIFTVGESSFTDMKGIIQVGIPESLIGKTKEEIFMDAKWRLIHEVGHILYTDSVSYGEFIDTFAKYMNTKHGISESLGKKVGDYYMNGLEDGREENVSKIQEPGNEKYIQVGRAHWYLDNEIVEVEPGTEDKRELFDTLFCLTSMATTGFYAYHYPDIYQSRQDLMDMLRNVKSLVNQFVSCTDPDVKVGLPSAIPYLWQIVYTMEDWLADIMKRIPEDDLDDLLNQLSNQAGANGSSNNSSYGSQGTHNGQQGGGNQQQSSGGNQQQSGGGNQQQNSANNQQNGGGSTSGQGSDSSSGNGGRIDRVEDEDDAEYDIDMNAMVEKAMRECISDAIEEEFNEVQQASFEDMLKANEELTEAGTADPNDIQQVEDYYRTINPNKRGHYSWDVEFSETIFKQKPIETEHSVKLEAKLLNKEFEKIFLNKADFDSRNRKRGYLNTNDLYKIKNRDYNIFIKKGNPKNTDYVFYVLVDGSGSMDGDKYVHAMRACSILEESLKGIAPVKIVMFDYGDGKVRHRIIKGFKENAKGNSSWAYANSQRARGCNMDGFSIRVATKELKRRKELKKILFTLSDGQPNGPSSYSGTRGENDVAEAVAEARKLGIAVFNIFFASSKREREEDLPAFRHMYRNKGIVSCAPSDISRELLRVVKKELNN